MQSKEICLEIFSDCIFFLGRYPSGFNCGVLLIRHRLAPLLFLPIPLSFPCVFFFPFGLPE